MFFEAPRQFPLAGEIAGMERMHAKVLLQERANHTFARPQRFLNGSLVLPPPRSPVDIRQRAAELGACAEQVGTVSNEEVGRSGVGFSVFFDAVIFRHERKQTLDGGIDLVCCEEDVEEFG